jgi:hypothetical protein
MTLPHIANNDSLCQALANTLAHQGYSHQSAPLERLKDKGLAHDHVRLVGTGILARIPKHSQMQLSAMDNLAYQSACFTRASATGYAPRLIGQILPCDDLPRGALLVEEIVGRNAVLPDDLMAIVQSLASMHTLALPGSDACAPLRNAPDPLRDLLADVQSQAAYFSASDTPPSSAAMALAELERLERLCADRARPAQCLIAFDGHPGNFVVRPDGRAILVDLEKCRYSYAPLDLAHATLYTSTTWDIDACTELSQDQIVQAYAGWAHAVGGAMAHSLRPWHVPLRRAMWLWSVTWCAKWRATSVVEARADADGEDWSSQRSSESLVAHVRERTAHYLDPVTVQMVLDGFDALEAQL